MSTLADQNSASQAGQKSSSEELYAPWERIPKAPEEPVGAPSTGKVPTPKKVELAPWERIKSLPKVVPAMPVASSTSSGEKAMIEQVKLSPQESVRDRMINQSPENIAELRAEIAKTKDPKNKAILQAEPDKLTNVTQREIDPAQFTTDKDSPEYIGDFSKESFKKVDELASKNEDFVKIKDFLKNRNMLPKLTTIYNNANGEFTSYGENVPPEGILGMNFIQSQDMKGNIKPRVVGTYVHEYVHAAMNQIYKLASSLQSKSNKTPEESRFYDTYEKTLSATMRNNFKEGVQNLLQSLDKMWTMNNGNYRSTTGEAVAFAVGNYAGGKGKNKDSYETPNHVDASLASTFMILLDQASKIKQDEKKAK